MNKIDKLFEMVEQDIVKKVLVKPKKVCSTEKFIRAESDILNAFSNFLSTFKRMKTEYDTDLRREVEVEFSPEQRVKLRKVVMEKMDLLNDYINEVFGSKEVEIKAIKSKYDDDWGNEEDDDYDDDDYDDDDDDGEGY